MITKVEARWDDGVGVDPGWYVEAYDEAGYVATSSVQDSFPVNVARMLQGEHELLRTNLEAAFPAARVIVR